MATKGNKKGFLHLSKSINPTASSPLLNDAIKEQIVLYTKLFLIMGLSWIFEILEPLVLQNRNEANDEDCNILVLSYILRNDTYFTIIDENDDVLCNFLCLMNSIIF